MSKSLGVCNVFRFVGEPATLFPILTTSPHRIQGVTEETILNSSEFVTAHACWSFFPVSLNTVSYTVSDTQLANSARTDSLTEIFFRRARLLTEVGEPFLGVSFSLSLVTQSKTSERKSHWSFVFHSFQIVISVHEVLTLFTKGFANFKCSKCVQSVQYG